MSFICPDDPDFRICLIRFENLLAIQAVAEEGQWANRWSSEAALRDQVAEKDVVLQTFLREKRDGVVRAHRCLVLFSNREPLGSGGITTLDLPPSLMESFERLDRDSDVRAALLKFFSIAGVGPGALTMVGKTWKGSMERTPTVGSDELALFARRLEVAKRDLDRLVPGRRYYDVYHLIFGIDCGLGGESASRAFHSWMVKRDGSSRPELIWAVPGDRVVACDQPAVA